MRRRLVRAVAMAAAVLVLLVFLAGMTPQGRIIAKTAGLVIQVLPNAPVKPLSWFTPDPERIPVTYPGPNGAAEADLYLTEGEGKRAALVLFLGVNPAGRDDDRVINLATALARTGFAVLVPWSENMVSGRVDPSDVELLVRAFEYLKAQDFVDPERIGGGGFCVGSSLLMVAAADPRIRDDVRFINFFSGYYDGRDYLAQFGARQAFYQDGTRPWEVDPLTTEAFRRMLIEGLPLAREQAALERHFKEEEDVEEGEPPREELTPEEVATLSPEARAVFGLLSGAGTVEEARRLIEQLPSDMLAEMDVLSPKNHLDGLRADLWIMHDVGDDLAPVEESRRLFDAVGTRENVRFTEFSFFQHVDPGKDGGPLDLVTESWKLLRHLYRVVQAAG